MPYFCERCLLGLCLFFGSAAHTSWLYSDSFGNPTRVDYGTGHETMFVCFLLCLEEIGLVRIEEHKTLVCRVFTKYMSLVRTLQTLYWSVSVSAVWLVQYCIVFASSGLSRLVLRASGDWMIIVFFHFIGRYGHFCVNQRRGHFSTHVTGVLHSWSEMKE